MNRASASSKNGGRGLTRFGSAVGQGRDSSRTAIIIFRHGQQRRSIREFCRERGLNPAWLKWEEDRWVLMRLDVQGELFRDVL